MERLKNSNIILYSNGCPKCKILEKKLVEKNIEFTKMDDKEKMIEKGIFSVPVLEVDGQVLDFLEANSLINSYFEIKRR